MVAKFLLEPSATDAVIQEAYSDVLRYRQSTGVTKSFYAIKMWTLATRCGNVFRTMRLKFTYADRVLEALRDQVRNYLTRNRKVDYNTLALYTEGLRETYRHGTTSTSLAPAQTSKPRRKTVMLVEQGEVFTDFFELQRASRAKIST